MALKVFLSPLAFSQLVSTLEYTNENWGKQAAKNFADKFIACTNIISEQPQSFPVSNKKKKLHRCVVTGQTTFYYRLKENKIEIAFLFDNRLSPTKLKNFIKIVD